MGQQLNAFRAPCLILLSTKKDIVKKCPFLKIYDGVKNFSFLYQQNQPVSSQNTDRSAELF